MGQRQNRARAVEFSDDAVAGIIGVALDLGDLIPLREKIAAIIIFKAPRARRGIGLRAQTPERVVNARVALTVRERDARNSARRIECVARGLLRRILRPDDAVAP